MANYNTAYATNYRLEIAGAEYLNYFMQNVQIPGINAEGVEAPYKSNNTYWQADRIDYDPLSITFAVDEDFKNYLFLYEWIRTCTSRDIPLSRQKDATLHVLTANKTRNMKVFFKGCFPQMLSSVEFESAVTDPNVITCSATIRYQYFDIE